MQETGFGLMYETDINDKSSLYGVLVSNGDDMRLAKQLNEIVLIGMLRYGEFIRRDGRVFNSRECPFTVDNKFTVNGLSKMSVTINCSSKDGLFGVIDWTLGDSNNSYDDLVTHIDNNGGDIEYGFTAPSGTTLFIYGIGV